MGVKRRIISVRLDFLRFLGLGWVGYLVKAESAPIVFTR